MADGRGHGIDALSARQRDCLQLAAEGLTSKEIGRRLGVSPSTVDNHISAVAARLQVAGRREAVRIFRNSDQRQPPDQSRDAMPPSPLDWFSLPPLGGRPNSLGFSRRIIAVLQIALAGTLVFAAVVFTISGLIQVLK